MTTHRIVFTSSGNCTQVSMDPKLLRQAISNLLSNAAKYSPGHDEVRFDLFCGETEIVLHVRDQGIGIPKEDQEHLFEVFHRGRNVAGISGTGLGLPIVKQAVDAHGGTISLVSEVNLGTTFTIQLPRLQSA
jgi:signal transduction histidine kinase